VAPKTIADQDAWLLMRPFFGLRIENAFEPFQADLRVYVSRFGACVMPSRGGVRRPVASMG
jgi:hypothetical protein